MQDQGWTQREPSKPGEESDSLNAIGLSWSKVKLLVWSTTRILSLSKLIQFRILRSLGWGRGIVWSRPWQTGIVVCLLILGLVIVLQPDTSNESELPLDDPIIVIEEAYERLNRDQNSAVAEAQPLTANAFDSANPSLRAPVFHHPIGSGPSFPSAGSKPFQTGNLDSGTPTRGQAVWLTGTIEEMPAEPVPGKSARANSFFR